MMESRIAKVRDKLSRLRHVRGCMGRRADDRACFQPSVARAESDNGFWSDYLINANRRQAALNDTASQGTRCLLGNVRLIT